MKITIRGHCYSLKNHRPIFNAGKGGRPFLGKSATLRTYQRAATESLRAAWSPRPPIEGKVQVALVYYYAGKEPDALGFAETIFDCLQAAGIVTDDAQLVPSGCPAISRIHVGTAEQRVEVELVGDGLHG